MSGQVIGQRSAIANGGSAALLLTRPDELLPLMAVRQDERVFVYVNSCPHLGWPLDFEPGQFLSHDRRYILCSGHGALFRIEDGRCIRGPCAGAALTLLPVRIEGDDIVVADEAAGETTTMASPAPPATAVGE